MPSFSLSLGKAKRKALEARIRNAEQLGDTRTVKRGLAILALVGVVALRIDEVGSCFRVSVKTVRNWIKDFLLRGVASLEIGKSPGRPAKLTKSQRKELAQLIDEGPSSAGFLGNCWRSPMIQALIKERFGVSYSVFYIAQLLKNMDFSYQKARFVSDKENEAERARWLSEEWPEILTLAERKNAYILFGDEVSFPQWGTLSYTWARRGQQPMVRTAGKRKGYKVFGLIDYFTGKFFFKGQEEKLNSETYIQFLKEVLARIRKHAILIQDGAPYHRSAQVKQFFAENARRLSVYQLPSYSPDYNPIEQLWKNIKHEGTHMHYFPTFEALRSKVEEALVYFEDIPGKVLSLFGFYRKLDSTPIDPRSA